MSVKSYFESERRKKQITWMLIILGALFIGAMLSSYYSDDKKPASVPQTTSTTQISMVPSKADYEQHQAIYNDRLLNLERESKEAKQREAKLQSDKKRLEDRIALLEKNAPKANRPTEAARSGRRLAAFRDSRKTADQQEDRLYKRQSASRQIFSPATRCLGFFSGATSCHQQFRLCS